MPFTTQDNLLTLDAGLAHFKTVYMPAGNYSRRTREEYESDLSDLISFLTLRNLTTWQVVGLRDLQSYLADLDRRGLAPASRNRKTYSIRTFSPFLTQSRYLHRTIADELIPPTVYEAVSPLWYDWRHEHKPNPRRSKAGGLLERGHRHV